MKRKENLENQTAINSFNREFQHDFRKIHLNHIIFEGGYEHYKKMSEICVQLKKRGVPFYCRYPLASGGIVDIMLPVQMIAIEVMDSETKERFDAKYFPDCFTVVPVKIDEKIKYIMGLIL